MARWLGWLTFLAAVTSVACGARPASDVPSARAAPSGEHAPPPVDEAVLDEVFATVVTARRLELTPPVSVEQVELPRFRQLVRAHLSEPDEADRMLGEVFDFSPPAAEASSGEPFEEQVAAFYDVRRDRIVMPRVASTDRTFALAVFAHEAQHALQHRHFPIRATEAGLQDDDARLAFLALVEGDAQVTMGVYLGHTHGVPVPRALRRLTDITAGVPVHHDATRRLHVTTGGAASAGMVAFPYEDGMRFVADLYRAGGFDLVNAAYARPPVATMHILHPDRYVAGEQPAEVGAPPAVGRVVREGRWGELRTRLSLESCLPPSRARAIASAWRGDRYVLGRVPRVGSTLSWLSVWASEEQAEAFVRALREPRCARPAHRAVASRRGRRVLVTVGATKAEHVGLSARAASVDVHFSTARPLADVRIPERELIPERRKGRVGKGRFRSIWLGLEAPLGEADDADVGEQDVELTLTDPNSGARAMLALYDHVPRGRSLEQLFGDLIDAAERASGMRAVSRGRQRHRGPLGQAIVARYLLGSATVELHVVPLCAETGALVWMAVAPSPAAASWLRQRWGAFRWIVDRRIPACRWLDPK